MTIVTHGPGNVKTVSALSTVSSPVGLELWMVLTPDLMEFYRRLCLDQRQRCDEDFYLESWEDSVHEALEALDAVRDPVHVGDGVELAEEGQARHPDQGGPRYHQPGPVHTPIQVIESHPIYRWQGTDLCPKIFRLPQIIPFH